MRQRSPRQSKRCDRDSLPLLRTSADRAAVQVVALLAPDGAPVTWRRQLKLGTASRRAAACVALGTRMRGRSALLLASILRRDLDAWVREQAAWTLGMVGGTAAWRAVGRALHTEAAPAVRAALWAAAARLGPLGEELEALALAAVVSGEPMEAVAATTALRACAPARLLQVGHVLSLHRVADVRRAAVAAWEGLEGAQAAWASFSADPDASVSALAHAYQRHAAAAG
ncbi:MAG: hypothetical protein HY904_23550 [Deltaproteobacteria bacterium]|nr:hypothetical protein [Deltaproteobacteria bacterium]